MQGITRPCRHSLGADLHEQWVSHLCGLCLTLRDESGQAARALTGYDMMLPSILVEAQAGRAARVAAGRCALRGMRTASVVAPGDPGVRLSAAASLLAGAAGIDDKVADGDVPALARPLAGRLSLRARQEGLGLAGESSFEASALSSVSIAASGAESSGATLGDYLAPSGAAAGSLFSHTAAVAGCPTNGKPLRRAGDAFGRLVHLLDAVDDHARDASRGSFNPLAASGTAPAEAHRVAVALAAQVRSAVGECSMRDPDLVSALVGPVLDAAVARRFPAACSAAGRSRGSGEARGQSLRRRSGHAGGGPASVAVAAAVAAPAVMTAIFGGRGRRGRGQPYGDPYAQGGFGGRGPGCCDILACDCCANLACEDCCGEEGCCCCL